MKGKGKYRRSSRSRSYSPPRRNLKGGKGKGRKGKYGHPANDPGSWDCPRCNYFNFARNQVCGSCKYCPENRAPPFGWGGSRGYEYEYEYYERCRYQDHQNTSYPSSYLGPAGYPPPGSQPAANPWHATPPQRDYALEKPDAYQAFIKTSVKQGTLGVEIVLSDKMCEDKHVLDLLACLDAWFRRTFGNPALTGMTWTLGCLDLARNGLSDDSLKVIIERLQVMDVRVRQLLLDANFMNAKGLCALTDYVWNCKDPIHVISLVDNQITCDPDRSDDPVAALLRCIYNHPRYPVACPKSDPNAPASVLPLTLMFKNNVLHHSKELLDAIKKNGQDKVMYCDSQAPVTTEGYHQYFLVLFLPDVHEQKTSASPAPAPYQPLLQLEDSLYHGTVAGNANAQEMALNPPRSKIHSNRSTRYFVIKCNSAHNLQKSVEHNCWATQAHNELRLNDAFRTAPHVVFIFSLNQSSAFQGYALMKSKFGKSKQKQRDIFDGWSLLCDIKWQRYYDLEFEEVGHIENPMNEYKPVTHSRDGQEMPNSAGREICLRIDRLEWIANPDSFVGDENEPETCFDMRPEMPRRRRVRNSETDPRGEVPLDEPNPRAQHRRRYQTEDAMLDTPRPKSHAISESNEDGTVMRRRRRRAEDGGRRADDLDNQPPTPGSPQWPGLHRKEPIGLPVPEEDRRLNEPQGMVGEAREGEPVVKKFRRVKVKKLVAKDGPLLPLNGQQLQADDRKALERGISERIAQVPDLPQEEGTFDMLAEYVVCLLLSGKRQHEVEREVTGFLEHNSSEFIRWLAPYLQEFLQSRHLLTPNKSKKAKSGISDPPNDDSEPKPSAEAEASRCD